MELQDWSKEAKDFKLGKYRHYKGNEYEVIGISRHTETMEELVVYKSLYGEGDLWVRPLAMFIETTEVGGKTINRFEYTGN
jgi:cyclomaltodextrinase